jgi:mannose-6-phosphate isomerase-like protein (cupin superfamily)
MLLLDRNKALANVKVIAERGSSYEKNAPSERIFNLYDFATAFDPMKPTRMYTGDEFRVAVFRMTPGQEQEVHMHPSTTHAWFVFEGDVEITMEDDRRERAGPGTFCVHPRNTVHGLKNVGTTEVVYVTLSIGS